LLYENGSNQLGESANLTWNDSGTDKILKVGATDQGRIEVYKSGMLTAYITADLEGRFVAGGDDVSNAAFGYVGGPGGMCFPDNLKIRFGMGGAMMLAMQVSSQYHIGIAGLTSPTAKLHIPAASGGAGTAPIKIDPGTLMGTPEDGAFEYDAANLYFTVGSTRKTVTLV
jgi:hypothetical protein